MAPSRGEAVITTNGRDGIATLAAAVRRRVVVAGEARRRLRGRMEEPAVVPPCEPDDVAAWELRARLGLLGR